MGNTPRCVPRSPRRLPKTKNCVLQYYLLQKCVLDTTSFHFLSVSCWFLKKILLRNARQIHWELTRIRSRQRVNLKVWKCKKLCKIHGFLMIFTSYEKSTGNRKRQENNAKSILKSLIFQTRHMPSPNTPFNPIWKPKWPPKSALWG